MLNRQVVLKSRPRGVPATADFELREAPVPTVGAGEFLVAHSHLGLAPAARIRMSEGRSYADPTPLGCVVYGQAAGRVVASRHEHFAVGDVVVVSDGGWQEYSISTGATATKVTAPDIPLTVWLGALGVSGLTAYVGLLDIGKAKADETVVVSAASGGVGSVVGQIARIKRCRVVGIAGGQEKCAHVHDDLGFEACVDYRAAGFAQALDKACPDGIDVYFDNVGGMVRDAVIPRMNLFGRVVVCGMISEYNSGPAAGPSWFPILTKRLTVRGFLMRDHLDRKRAFEREMADWYRAGLLRVREDVVAGLEQAPAAFIGMLEGRNFGKTIVKLA
jgi:NADPH-dependent curcumin reductase CurA